MATLSRLFKEKWFGRMVRSGRHKTAIPFKRKVMFEALESRLLMSADIVSPLVGPAITSQLQQIATPPVTTTIHVGPDSVDAAITPPVEWQSTPETVWNITGDVPTVTGGANNRETFVVGANSNVGLVDGGAGGFDSLVLAPRTVDIAVYTTTGPDSGTIQLDSYVLDYRGMEPTVDSSVAVNKVFNIGSTPPVGTGSDDSIRIDDASPGNLLIDSVNGTFEDLTTKSPSGRLTIDTGGGNDTIKLDELNFSTEMVIDGGAGNDTLDVSSVRTTVIRFSDGTAALKRNNEFIFVRNVETFLGASFIDEQGIPSWIQQGPGPILNAQAAVPGNNPVVGAVQSLAVHPFNGNVMFAGSVNGGVWRTTDGGTNWTPLTDQFPSLSIGDIKISPLDSDGAALSAATPLSKLVVYAGTGSFSSSGRAGLNVGVLKSADGGASWQLLGASSFAGLAIAGVAPTTTQVAGKQVVLAGALDKAVATLDVNGSGSFLADATLAQEVQRQGGLFRSTDGGATWSSLSGDGSSGLPAGGVTDMTRDASNPSRFYAGVLGSGVFRTDDAGATWTAVSAGLADVADAERIILSTSEAADGVTGNRPLYAALIGDRTRLTAPVVVGPAANTITVASPDLFYVGNSVTIAIVATPHSGVFVPAQWEGATVTGVNTATGVITLSAPLANAHAIGNIVFVNGKQLTGLFRSADLGVTWTRMDRPADADGGLNSGGQAITNFQLLADRTSPSVVFASGDASPDPVGAGQIGVANPNASGVTGYFGRIFRGDAGAAAGSQWAPVVGTNANSTAPHADSREMSFAPDGSLIEVDDGGVYRLANPNAASPARTWTSLIGNLRTSEIYSVAYDALNNVYFIGNQDTGSSEQPAGLPQPSDINLDGIPDDAAARWTFRSILQADGQGQLAVPLTGPNRTLRFSMSNGFSFFYERTFNAAGVLVGGFVPVPLRSGNGADGLPGTADDPVALSGLDAVDSGLAGFNIIPYVLNQVDNTRMLIGFNGLYESTDRLDTVSRIQARGGNGVVGAIAYGGFFKLTGNPALSFADTSPDAITRADGGSFVTDGFEVGQRITVGNAGTNNGIYLVDAVVADRLTVSSSATAGADAGVTAAANVAGVTIGNADLVYEARFNKMFVRTGTGALVERSTGLGGGSKINDIAVDPADWRIAYAVDGTSVFRTTDGGQNWASISSQLHVPGLESVAVIDTGGGNRALLVGTAQGVYRASTIAPGTTWTKVGRGLPNASVSDVSYIDVAGSTTTDTVAAGTLGRGLFTLAGDADTILAQSPVLTINGTGSDDQIRIHRNTGNASLLDIFVSSAVNPAFTLPIASVERIDINGLGGNDTLTIDIDNGLINLPDAVVFNGGDGNDTLVVQGGPVITKDTTGPTAGVTTFSVSDVGRGNRQTTRFSNVETFTDSLTEASFIDRIGSGLGDLFNWLGLVNGAPNEFAVLGNSLPRAIMGISPGAGAPASDQGKAPDAPAEAGPTGAGSIALQQSQGLQRLFESGTGAFSLADIGSTSIATFDALRDKIDALDNVAGNVTYTLDGSGRPTFNIGVVKPLGGTADFDVNTTLFGGQIGLNGLIDVNAEVVVNLKLGIDANGFFVDTSGSDNELLVRNIALNGSAHAQGRFGFLDLDVTAEQMAVDKDVFFKVDLRDPGGDGKLRLGDLGPSLADKVDISVGGNPAKDDVVLKLSAKASALGAGPTSSTWPAPS